MSDSEESFESADEGETERSSSIAKQRKEPIKIESPDKTQEEAQGEAQTTKKSDLVTIPAEVKTITKETCDDLKENSHLEVKSEILQETTNVEDKSELNLSTNENSSDKEQIEGAVNSNDIIKDTASTVNKTDPQLDVKNPLHKLAEESDKKSNWGWGSWGSSIIQTATSSVSTFTHSVGEGFSNVLETVESTLGAPDPKELAKSQTDEEDKKSAKTNVESPSVSGSVDSTDEVDPKDCPERQNITRCSDEHDPQVVIVEDNTEKDAGWFSTLGVATLTGVVKNTVQQTSSIVTEKSKDLVHGGLDVLETIGKKTYDVLAEGDHGIKKTIEKAKEKPVLSQLLREAAEEADEAAKQEEEFIESRKSHFGAQFDDFQGLVQLEALEMLSNQSEAKANVLQSTATSEKLSNIKAVVDAVKETFDCNEFGDDDEKDEHVFTNLMNEYTGMLALNITAAKLIQTHEKVRNTISEYDAGESEMADINKIHQKSIQSMAELTARIVEHFHKIGQLTLMDSKGPATTYKDKSSALLSLTKCMCCEIGIVSRKYTNCITDAAGKTDDPETANPLITNVFLEADNSCTYILNAFQLLFPVMHQAILQISET